MYSFNIILTEVCNANCTHCYMAKNSNKTRKSLSEVDIDKLLEKIPNNTKTIILTGGEIFLVKDILYYTIKKIKQKNEKIIIGLESNGIYLYKDLNRCQVELRTLKEMGVNYIRFSDDPFHLTGGVDLEKVRNLKKLECNDTPIIKFLVQDKAVPLGNAKKLNSSYISKQNCMNKITTKDNPYLFIDIDGNIFTCAWKCVPSVGNIFKDEWDNIVNNLKIRCNELILTGKIEEAISDFTGKSIDIIKKQSKAKGQCSLCIENFGVEENI